MTAENGLLLLLRFHLIHNETKPVKIEFELSRSNYMIYTREFFK